jgi:hypothetical protein
MPPPPPPTTITAPKKGSSKPKAGKKSKEKEVGEEPTPLPGKLRDELKRTIAVYNYSMLHSEKGKQTDSQYQFMYSLYHGDGGDGVSHLKMLVKGQGKDCLPAFVSVLLFWCSLLTIIY